MNHDNEQDEMLPDYTGLLTNGVRGKYAGRIQSRQNIVTLAPDVAAAFPTGDAVNEALRFVIKMARENPLSPQTVPTPVSV